MPEIKEQKVFRNIAVTEDFSGMDLTGYEFTDCNLMPMSFDEKTIFACTITRSVIPVDLVEYGDKKINLLKRDRGEEIECKRLKFAPPIDEIVKDGVEIIGEIDAESPPDEIRVDGVRYVLALEVDARG